MLKISDQEKFEDLDVVKKYFNRIFTVLDAKIRERLKVLNVSEARRQILLNELAFLSDKKQEEYIEELFIIWNKIIDD